MAGLALTENCLSRPVGDEAVLLNLETSRYYALDAVGARLLHHLLSSPSRAAALEAMRAEFDVAETALTADADELVGALVQAGLVEPRE